MFEETEMDGRERENSYEDFAQNGRRRKKWRL